MYLIVENHEFKESESPQRTSDYCVQDSSGRIFLLSQYDIIKDGVNTVVIGRKRLSISELKILDMDELSHRINSEEYNVTTKDADRKLLDPDKHNFKPFTKAVVKLLRNNRQKRTLSDSDYEKILQILREINKLSDGSKEISIKKAEELLELYNLSITDLLKDELK